MENDENTRRFEVALSSAQPAEALHALAISLKSEGMSNEALSVLFAQFLRLHRDDPDERLWDAIADVMDFIAYDRL